MCESPPPASWTPCAVRVLVLYRESFLLEKDVLKKVLASEARYIQEIADALKVIAGLQDEDDEGLHIVANLLV